MNVFRQRTFGIPVFVVQTEEEQVDPKFYDAIYHIQDLNGYDIKLYSRQIETAAKLYEEKNVTAILQNVK